MDAPKKPTVALQVTQPPLLGVSEAVSCSVMSTLRTPWIVAASIYFWKKQKQYFTPPGCSQILLQDADGHTPPTSGARLCRVSRKQAVLL